MDFTDPKRKRTPKASVKAYKRITSTNNIDWKYFPTPDVWIPAPGETRREYLTSGSAEVFACFNPFFITFALLRLLLRN